MDGIKVWINLRREVEILSRYINETRCVYSSYYTYSAFRLQPKHYFFFLEKDVKSLLLFLLSHICLQICEMYEKRLNTLI